MEPADREDGRLAPQNNRLLGAWMPSSFISSVTQSCPTLCKSMDYSMPGHPVHHQLPEFTQTHVHWVSDAIQSSHPLLSPLPNLSQHQGLFNESALSTRGPKYWSFSFNISPSNEYSGLTSFRMDWLNLLAVQGTLKSLLPQHSSKASIRKQSYSGYIEVDLCVSCYRVSFIYRYDSSMIFAQ